MSTVSDVVILDRGFGATTFSKIVGPLLQVLPNMHAFFSQRIGFSDRFLYRHLLPRLLDRAAGPVLMPLRSPLESHLQPTILYDTVLDIGSLGPQTIYQFNNHHACEAAKSLDILYKSMTTQAPSANRTILFIDSLEPFGNALETVIRKFMQAGPKTRVVVWLHCSIQLVPHDLLGQVGSVLVFLPSALDLRTLQDVLPLPTRDWSEDRLPQHLLLYGHVGEPASWSAYGPLRL